MCIDILSCHTIYMYVSLEKRIIIPKNDNPWHVCCIVCVFDSTYTWNLWKQHHPLSQYGCQLQLVYALRHWEVAFKLMLSSYQIPSMMAASSDKIHVINRPLVPIHYLTITNPLSLLVNHCLKHFKTIYNGNELTNICNW